MLFSWTDDPKGVAFLMQLGDQKLPICLDNHHPQGLRDLAQSLKNAQEWALEHRLHDADTLNTWITQRYKPSLETTTIEQ